MNQTSGGYDGIICIMVNREVPMVHSQIDSMDGEKMLQSGLYEQIISKLLRGQLADQSDKLVKTALLYLSRLS